MWKVVKQAPGFKRGDAWYGWRIVKFKAGMVLNEWVTKIVDQPRVTDCLRAFYDDYEEDT